MTVRGLAAGDWLGDYVAQACTVNLQEIHPNHTTFHLVGQTDNTHSQLGCPLHRNLKFSLLLIWRAAEEAEVW